MPIPRRNMNEFFIPSINKLDIPNTNSFIINNTDYHETYYYETDYMNYSIYIPIFSISSCETDWSNYTGNSFLDKRLFINENLFSYYIKKVLLEPYSKGLNENKFNIHMQFKEFKIYRHYLGKNANKPIYNINQAT